MASESIGVDELLAELFSADLAAAVRACQSCHQEHPAAAHALYSGAGFVLRCPGCGDVAAIVSEVRGEYAVTLRGIWRAPPPG
jgi:hypothetical protein